ncbi:MAG: RagB/SusD family nutrient uptake outer membrane protein [Mucilaginibacter sp.]|uniref:RagB/SusD family nutrient uptake outer membrane protein n=1 Tax=Mucilaginibacter sp. TaxID=1882438 RepID=UPI0032678A76
MKNYNKNNSVIMKYNYKSLISKGILVLAGTVILSACKKSFLEPDPLSFYEPAVTFTTEAGIKAALATADRNLGFFYNGYSGNDNNVPMSTEYYFSDMSVYGKTDAGGGLFDDINAKLTPSGPFGTEGDGSWLGYFWNENYNGIKYANTVTSYIDGITALDAATKNAYKGRAYFHRAFRYMALMWQFGDVPLVTKILQVPKQNYRSTKKAAILDMLTKDMEFAIQWVPDQKNSLLVGQVNKAACRQLLIKIYLCTGRYAEAEAQADILINSSGFALMKNSFGTFNPGGEAKTWPITRNVIWDLHRPENKLIASNTEVLMGLPNYGIEGFTNFKAMRVFGPFWNDGNIIGPDGKKALNNYARNNANYNPVYDWVRAMGRGIATTSSTYFAQHPLWNVNGIEDKQDLRHNSTVGNWVNMTDFRYNDPTSTYKGQNIVKYHPTTNAILVKDTIRDWFDFPLYKIYMLDVVDEAGLGGVTFAGATKGGNANWYLYRLAETYLLRAEAKLYQGKDATSDVNEVRKRANCAQLYTSVNIGDIVNERARELYLEEWRNVELKRISYCLAKSGKPDEWGNTYTLATYDKQNGTDNSGGSYWYQRIAHYTPYNKGNINLGTGVVLKYTMNKYNMYWPIPNYAIVANNRGKLFQNFGYTGYDASIPEWDNYADAVADEDKVN